MAATRTLGYDFGNDCSTERPKMPQRIIVYWRDMPAQVIIKEGRKTAKRQLPERFEQAIDMAAMKADKRDTDAYLAEWRKGEPELIEGEDFEALAEAEAKRIEAEFPQERLVALANAGGLEPKS
jgi:Virulence factor